MTNFQRFLAAARAEGFEDGRSIPTWSDAARIDPTVTPEQVLAELRQKKHFGEAATLGGHVEFPCVCGAPLVVWFDERTFDYNTVGCKSCRMIYGVDVSKVRAKWNLAQADEDFIRGRESTCSCRHVSADGVHPVWCRELPPLGETRRLEGAWAAEQAAKRLDPQTVLRITKECGCRFVGASRVTSCGDHL